AASSPLASTDHHAERPSSTYLSTSAALARIAAGVRRYCNSGVMLMRTADLRRFAKRSASLVQCPALGLGELGGRGLVGREVARGLLGIHLDLGVGGNQLVGDRHLLNDLDALLAQRV